MLAASNCKQTVVKPRRTSQLNLKYLERFVSDFVRFGEIWVLIGSLDIPRLYMDYKMYKKRKENLTYAYSCYLKIDKVNKNYIF